MSNSIFTKDLWKLHCPECGAVVNSRTSWTWLRPNNTKSCESCGIPLKKVTTKYWVFLPMVLVSPIVFFVKLPEPYGRILVFSTLAVTLILAGMEMASTRFVRREDEK